MEINFSFSRGGSFINQQQADFWNGSADDSILNADPEYRGDRTDVDVILCDESGWYGHTEFVKTGTGEPSNFVGQNVLKSGFATSATTLGAIHAEGLALLRIC